jgi:hypothetical protein
MFPLTRILSLAAAGALVALTAACSPAHADDLAQNPGPVGTHEPILAEQNPGEIGECHLHRRAISRHACQARLWRGLHIDTAENK